MKPPFHADVQGCMKTITRVYGRAEGPCKVGDGHFLWWPTAMKHVSGETLASWLAREPFHNAPGQLRSAFSSPLCLPDFKDAYGFN
eukprot:337122-Pelagomonas_calceolata.AAC.2